MKRLLQQKEKAIKRLLELADKMLVGSISETYRRCGSPSCRCHKGGPKHGPYFDVNAQGPNGRTVSYYVPKALHEPVFEGLDAWKQFRETAKQVAEMNKQLLLAQRATKAGGQQREK